MADSQRERELKFDVPDGFVVPDLSPLLPRDGSIEEQTLQLESTYFDTVGGNLLGAGLTLRKRTGDDDAGWQLKVPDGDARIEVRVPLGGRGVPAEVRELTAGLRGRAALKPIATLRTARHRWQLIDQQGVPLAEVVDDEVVSHVQREFAVTRGWREIEVELGSGSEKLLTRAASLLRKHGAKPASVGSKLAHALELHERVDPDPSTLSGTVAAYLDAQFAVLVRNDIELRRGGDVVHPTRVASRRYRSVLRVFGKILDSDRAARLDAELKWYAGALGVVRDTQVLRKHLDRSLDALPAELMVGPVRAHIVGTLDVDEAAARAALGEVMTSARYVALLAELRAWHEALPLTTDGKASGVQRFLARAERKLDRRLTAARGADHGDETHHRARKAAKRTRYVAELSTPVLGKRGTKAVKRAKKIQERFGDRQDNVMAAEFLRRLGTTAPGENGFTLGLLYQRERDHGDAIR